MTPCEKIGLKVGDEVKVTKMGAAYSGLNFGECCTLEEDDGSGAPYFRTKNVGLMIRLSTICYGTKTGWFEMIKTEAEKRGAKFGTMGVIKDTGEKCVYLRDSFPYENNWCVIIENYTNTQDFPCGEICLDHEPEFKEVPFHEAAHDQRMVVENLRDEWGQKLSDIFYSEKNSVYVVLTKAGGTDLLSPSSGRFTVRIPN